MRQICEFDSKVDLQKAVPGLSVDMEAAIETGVVLDTGTIGEYNDIDDPSAILGRVSDAFEAIDAQRKILKAGKKVEVSSPVQNNVKSSETKSE